MKALKKSTLILAGDIGGTKTDIGFFVKGKRRPILKELKTYHSKQSSSLEEIIEQFLDNYRLRVSVACFGIAGPVRNGRCKTTNLPWIVSELKLKKRFGWDRVRLINDLTANAYSIPFLNKKETFLLNKVNTPIKKNIGLIAPGTGLGEALLVFVDGRYIPVPSEGGHVDFSPKSETEIELWRYLNHRFGHVSIERVLSGQGIYNIYSWLNASGRYLKNERMAIKIKDMDPARAIAEEAINKNDPMCVEALDVFLSVFGSAAGNLALTGMTTGGIYLGGGIPPKILPVLKKNIFMKSFVDKGRFREVLEKVPVRVILNEKASILGAAYCAIAEEDML